MNDSQLKQSKSRPFAVFDIDGTLIRWQLYHAIADAMFRLGYFNKDAFETIRHARMQWKTRTHQDSFKVYERSLVSAYERLLSNITVKQFENASEAVFQEYKDQVYTYTRNLIKQLKNKNYLLFAISGSQTEIVAKIAQYYGFDDFLGSTYEQKAGKYTGKVKLAKDTKDLVLKQLVKKHGANYDDSIAVGDSEGDISMLEVVDKPIAFNPNKKLLLHAQANNWKIVIERKNVVYEMEVKDGQYILAQTN